MKILIITNYLGNKGGLGRYSSEVVKALEQFPLQTIILTESNKITHPNEKNLLRPVFNCSKFKLIFNFLANVYYTYKLSRNCDVIHAHDGWPYSLYGYFSTIGTKKKLFITGIGTYTITPLNKKIIGWILGRAYNKARNIFCISKYVQDEIKKKCPKAKTSVVFMGTTKLPTISKEQISEYNLIYKIEKFHPLVLTVGDIKRRKGQLDTLKALNILKIKYPNFKYVIIGNGDDVYYMDQIRDFVKNNNLSNNITIISNVYDDLILSFFYSVCDIFALNSNNDSGHFEGFGLVLLEAAQFGKPVVGSKDCGIESAIWNCYNGFLTEQGNHIDISNKIGDILDGRQSYFSQNSQEFYKRFSWNKTAEEYYKNYIL